VAIIYEASVIHVSKVVGGDIGLPKTAPNNLGLANTEKQMIRNLCHAAVVEALMVYQEKSKKFYEIGSFSISCNIEWIELLPLTFLLLK